MIIRPMELSDWEKGMQEVLANLSKMENIPFVKLQHIFIERINSGHHTLVAEEDGRIVGTATLVVGWKLLRGGVKHGRVSDVATHPDWEGKGVGSKLMEEIIRVALVHDCYKMTLGCNEKNVSWYERFGFKRHEAAMRIDLPQAKSDK